MHCNARGDAVPAGSNMLPESHEVSYFYLILRPGSFKVLREGIVEAVTALVSTVEEMPSTDISRPLASTSQVLIDKMTLRYDCSHHVVHIGVHHHQHQHILCKALGRTFNIETQCLAPYSKALASWNAGQGASTVKGTP